MAARGAAGGFVVASGWLTDDATAFAKVRNVQLIDGPRLHALIQSARGSSPEAATNPSAGAQQKSGVEEPRTAMINAPSCPLCAKPMMKRTAKRGANAGADFLGCSTYPTCRGMRSIS
jgi:restriction system protein